MLGSVCLRLGGLDCGEGSKCRGVGMFPGVYYAAIMSRLISAMALPGFKCWKEEVEGGGRMPG